MHTMLIFLDLSPMSPSTASARDPTTTATDVCHNTADEEFQPFSLIVAKTTTEPSDLTLTKAIIE